MIPRIVVCLLHHLSASRLTVTLIGGPNDMEKGLKELLEHKEGSGILLLFFKLFLYLIYVTIGQAGGTGKVPKPATEPKPSDDLSQEEKNRMQAAVKAWFDFQMAP